MQALSRRRTVRDFSEAPISVDALNRLLWAAQGVTGQDGKRTVPSAHAVHPLRLYVQAGRVSGLVQGLYEVATTDLTVRQVHGLDLQPGLANAAIDEQPWIGQAACIVIVCADMVTPSKHFADQRPLGRRGARYVYLEAGAAAQNLQLQAVAEGLGCVQVGGFNDEATADVLGLGSTLEPIVQLCVGYPTGTE